MIQGPFPALLKRARFFGQHVEIES
jgi:hypothetical protein